MRITEKRGLAYLFVILLFLASLPGNAGAVVYNLCADETTITMPDGAVVPAWGFGIPDALGCTPTVPGPTLTVGVGEPLVINLTNNLAEPVSLHILGQVLSNNSGPVMSGGRVRSFTHETAAGGTAAYQWNDFKPGSYLLQSGTNPAKQVQMGLFAPVVKDFAAGQAYLGVPYEKQRIVVFHEVDPAIQNAIAAGTYGPGGTITSSTHRDPHYFLINGKAYPQTSLDPGGTDPLSAGQTVLLRFFNAGLETHVPQIEGLSHMRIVAEDGYKLAFAKEQYNFEFPAARTADAVVIPGTGRYPIYDAQLNLTNAAAATMGGMLVHLEVQAAQPTGPVANNQAVTTPEDTPVAITLTGSDPENDPLTFAIVTGPVNGTLSGTAPNVTYTPNANYFGPDSFTFKVNDGTSDSVPATVSIDVTPVNDPPVANGQSVTTAEDTPAAITLTGTDPENDPLSYAVVTGPANGVLTGIAPNLTYTPNLNYFGPDSFTFTVHDGTVDSLPATVSIDVTPVNDPPVISSSPVLTATVGVQYTYQVVASDVENDPLSYSLTNPPAGMTISGTGLITWTPAAAGPQPVTVNASDGLLPATQSFTVEVSGGVPAIQLYFSTSSSAINVPGVSAPQDDADIYAWDGVAFSRIFSAVAAGVPATANVDGFQMVGALVYLSFTVDNVALPGLGAVMDEDIVVYDTATGTWSMFFDGSDVGLTTNPEDVDAFVLVPGGVVISTVGEGSVPGIAENFLGHDLQLCTGTFGPTTTCTWSVYFDGSDVGLTAGGENIDGVALSGGNIYLSTTGNYSVTGLSGGGDDVIACNSPTTGPNTACGSFTRYFDGVGAGLAGGNVVNIDAIDLP